MINKRVVITGIGVATPVGSSFKELSKNFLNGTSSLQYDQEYTRIMGRITESEFNNFNSEKLILDEFSMLAILSFERMLKDSSNASVDNIYIGVASGGNKSTHQVAEDLVKEKKPRPTALVKTMYSAAGNFIAMKHNVRGEVTTFCAACSSFAIALFQAFSMLRAGVHDNIAVGSSDAMYTPGLLKVWDASGATSPNTDKISVPFSKARNGIHHSEGSVFVRVETLESALKRKAKIYCEIVNVATYCGANSLVNPDMKSQSEAIVKAVKNININDITYINAHATGTPSGDINELESIVSALGELGRKIPISSTKQLTGHMIGTSGGIELLACITSLKYRKIIPNWFLKDIDVIDLNYNLPINQAQDKKHNIIMNNTFAFGGTNVVSLIKEYNEAVC